MKNLLFLFSLLFWVVSFGQSSNTCSLTGTLLNCKDSTKLYLVNLDSANLVTPITVINGTFSYQFKLTHPSRFMVHNERNQYDFRDRKFIWLEPSDIKLSGDFEFLKRLQVEGSASNLVSEKYNQMLDVANKQTNLLQEQMNLKPEKEKQDYQHKIDSLNKGLSNEIARFLITHKDSYVSLSELHLECYSAFRHLDKMQIRNVFANFSKEFQESEKGVQIKKYSELPEPPIVGDFAPEIIQLSSSGDTVRLSDFRGKYVLLDFWSSSCAPCRGESKWLRIIYKEYHSLGFEILGVSGDNIKQNWIAAMQHDSIPWKNVSDLKGWKNEAFLRYDIKYIPQKFLINPEGIIIKDEKLIGCEPVLKNILGEIFNHKNDVQEKLLH